jgi:hypothetical protein
MSQLISSPMTSALEQLQERSQFDEDGNPITNTTAGDDSDIEQQHTTSTTTLNDDSDDELPQNISDGKLSILYITSYHIITHETYVQLCIVSTS